MAFELHHLLSLCPALAVAALSAINAGSWIGAAPALACIVLCVLATWSIGRDVLTEWRKNAVFVPKRSFGMLVQANKMTLRAYGVRGKDAQIVRVESLLLIFAA
jgi:hypothetical protein